MKHYLLLIGIFIAVCVSTARAEVTIQLLARQCEGLAPDPNRPILGQLSCLSYIAGSLDQLILADGLAVQGGAKHTICAPPNVVKVEQLQALVIKVSKEKPEMQHESARSVLRGVIQGLYKCEPE